MRPRRTLRAPGDLTGFPTIPCEGSLVRVCRAEHGTWYFGSDGSGRFDLPAPEGTCYFATDAYAAVREASRLGPVSSTWVAQREVRVVTAPAAALAHTTHTDAGRYGLTHELVTVVPYALPQRWAAAFRALGLGGIRHVLRHDQRGHASGVSLFGPAGAGRRGDGRMQPLAASEVRDAGVAVFDPPHSSVLAIVE